MHLKNRQRALWGGTHPRAFTLMELGVAVLVFTLIAGVVTLAVAGATVTGANTRLENALVGRLRSLAATVASGPYDGVVAGSFERPDPCAAAPHRSCVLVMGREFEVSWTVSADTDDLGLSAEDPVGVQVSASASMPDGAVVSASRYVSPGNLGAVGKGLLRVRVDGESLDAPLYLITSAGAVAGTGSVVAGRAAIRADVADCTGAMPCRLALTPAGDLMTSDLGISASSVLSGASAVVLSDAATSEVSLVLEPRRSLVVSLLAVNPDGRMAWADDVASVCLYLESEVAGSLLRQPACNDVDPTRVTWTSLSTEFGAVPLPREAALSVLTDPSEGPCTAPGQSAWSGSWSEAAVCTGWTWGSFTGLRPGVTGFGDDVGSSVVLGDATQSHYTAVWESATSTSLALAATGWVGDPLWENPRDVPSCASSSSCTPPTSSPENACPGEHCNHTGGVAPVLTSPTSGVYKRASVEVSASASTSFDLVFADNDGGDNLVVTVVDSPAWLSAGGEGLVAEMTLYDGAAGSATVTLTAAAPASTADALVLKLGDGENQRTVTVLVGTGLSGVPAFLLTGPVTLAQATTTTSRVLGVDALGEPLTVLDVAVTAPEGVIVSSPVSGGDGWFTYSFSAPTAPAGSGVLMLSGGFATTEEVFVVSQTPGLVAVSVAAVSQGGSASLMFTVTDRAGDPHSNAHTWGTLSTAAGPWPLGLRLDPRGCMTDAAGICEVALRASDSAVTGAFTVTGAAGDVFSSTAGDVDPSIFSLGSGELSIEQGGTGTFSFTVFDGRGDPVASETVLLSTTASGVGLPGSVTTDASGSASVEITVSSSVTPGSKPITLIGGAGVLTTGFAVTSTISTVEVPATAVRVAQRGTNTVTVVATDPQGDPVPGRLLDITAPTGLFAPASVYTLADGSATFNVVAAEDRALGAAELTVSYGGTVLATVQLTVAAGIATLDIYGDLVTSAPVTVSVIAKNSAGLPLSGRSVVLESTDSRISVPAAAVVTNLTGAASFTVTSGRIPAGTYRFIARVDGREIPIEVVRP